MSMEQVVQKMKRPSLRDDAPSTPGFWQRSNSEILLDGIRHAPRGRCSLPW